MSAASSQRIWVFGHNPEGVESDPVGYLKHLANQTMNGQAWPWRHTYSNGELSTGFKFIVAYDRLLWGEFVVRQKTGPHGNDEDGWLWHYFAEPCSIYLYVPPLNYRHLTKSLRFPTSVDAGDYQKFCNKTKLQSLCNSSSGQVD